MKTLGLIGVGLLMIIFSSCQEDLEPTLIITVEDSSGVRLENALVITHPCLDGVSCDTARVNDAFAQTGLTNSSGSITFEYPYSAIIDVAAQWTSCDTPDVWCLDYGQTVARFESKKVKKGETNEYNVKVVVYPTK